MRTAALVMLAAVVLGAVCATPATAQTVVKKSANLVEVTVDAAGMSLEEAKADARRKAVEAGAGTFIHSQSQTKDFVLVKDTILTRSAGFVQSLEVLSQTKTMDDIIQIKAQAVVSIKGIEDMWGVVTNLLKQMGRPKIMVAINEKIGGHVQDDSTVQTRIENLLIKSGFQLVDKNQLKAIDRKDLAAAIAEDKPDKVQAIAKRFGAQLFITGSANATSSGASAVHGISLSTFGADGNIRCYRSDTAALLASQNARGVGYDRNARLAASKSLEVLGEKIGPAVQHDILRFWQDALEGRGEVVLEVEDVSFRQYAELKKLLRNVQGVKDINAKYSNKVARCSIESDTRAETLAERIIEVIENLEITDVSQNVIKAKFTQ